MALTKKEIQKLDASQKAKALREACAWGEYEQVSLLLKLGADAQAQATSAERAHPESSGSQSSAFKQIEKGDTALNAAARGGFLDAVKILVSSIGSPASQKEAAMRVSGTHGAQTPAMAAASSSNPEAQDVLVWLMELEPACAVKSATAQGPAWSAAQSGNGRGLARVAIFLEQERGIQAATQCFDEPDILGRTLLHWALASGSSEACQVAIERSGPHAFEQIDVRGCNVWLCAAKSGSWEPFDLLLAHAKKMKNPRWSQSEALMSLDALGFSALSAAAQAGSLAGCIGAWTAVSVLMEPAQKAEELDRAIVSALRAGRKKVAQWLGERKAGAKDEMPPLWATKSAREVLKGLDPQKGEPLPRRGRG